MFLRTLAATPLPSLISPSRTCSVPIYSRLKRCASWLASCMTLQARSVNRSYMALPAIGLARRGIRAQRPIVAGQPGQHMLRVAPGGGLSTPPPLP